MKLHQIKDVQRNIETGGWVKDLPNLPGVAVKVRGLFNSDAARMYAEARASMTEEEFRDPEVQDSLDIRIVHEAVLLDWDGIEDAEYDPDLALQLLSDPEYAVFRRAVNYAASVVAQQGKETLEAAAKN